MEEKDFLKKIIDKLYNKLLSNHLMLKNRSVAKHIEIDPRELFYQQSKLTGFNRLDIVVRYLAIEQYYGRNSSGYRLYIKMQGKRKKEESKEEIDKRWDVFTSIIENWEIKGYNEYSEIECDTDLNLIDGSHRLALSLYFRTSKIKCKIYPYRKKITYDLYWFIQHDFTLDEINLILQKYEELLDNKLNGGIFIGVLWSPAKRYFEEIIEKIKMIYTVTDVEDVILTKEVYKRVIKGIYYIDDIESWKVDKKIKALLSEDENTIRVFFVKIPCPNYRLKNKNYHIISTECEKIKKIIRESYKDKIKDYVHDIIIHTSDNYEQTDYIRMLLFVDLKLKDYFISISEFKWMLIKFDNNYMPIDFPEKFPFSKDIDMICSRYQLQEIYNKTITHFQTVLKEAYEIKTIREDRRIKLRIELRGFLVFQIDMSSKLNGLRYEFIEESIQRRKKIDNIFYSNINDEIYYRIIEILENPQKVWHRKYVEAHKERINFMSLDKIFEGDIFFICNLLKEIGQ